MHEIKFDQYHLTVLQRCFACVLTLTRERKEGFDLFMLKLANKSKSSYLAAGLIVSCLAYWIVSSWFMCTAALTATECLATEVKNLIKNTSQTILLRMLPNELFLLAY